MQNLLPFSELDPLPAAAIPKDDATLVSWLRLARSRRVGPQTFQRMIREHGSAIAALDALPDVAAEAGVHGYQTCPRDAALGEIEAGIRAGARLVPFGAPEYPARLAQIDDPPPVLWIKGRLPAPDTPSVALVGARNASALGLRMATHLGSRLAEAGIVTISGLARGIDTAVHTGSLATGTVAVLAGGLNCIYPAENESLSRQICETGALVSEMPPATHPQARHFPRRNRIISGLAPGLVVIEGAAKSGSLITARAAADQGREIMAIPGHPFDPRAAGCNMLIRDGATLVRSAEDIAAVIAAPAPPSRRVVRGPAIPPAAPAARPRPSDSLRQDLLNVLGPAPVSEDALIRQMRRPAPEVLAALMSLDIEGRVERHAGGLVSLAVGA